MLWLPSTEPPGALPRLSRRRIGGIAGNKQGLAELAECGRRQREHQFNAADGDADMAFVALCLPDGNGCDRNRQTVGTADAVAVGLVPADPRDPEPQEGHQGLEVLQRHPAKKRALTAVFMNGA